MKKITNLVVAILLASCGSNPDNGANADTNVRSTTPPPKQDTNPIGIMMGDTSIGINDSLTKDSLSR